jgi:ubiquinone/menaquinone biosynthesis C-methylase UbiE
MSQAQPSDTLQEWRDSAKYWETHAETIQTMFAPVTQALIEEAGITDGSAVLDVAGGPGDPSLTIAEVVGPKGSVTCTDAVAEMVAAARHRALRRGLNNISFRQCQADSLPFADKSFDEVVSRLGVMFFPDIQAALHEMLRVTKSKGRLSFAVWDEAHVNPFAYIVTDVLSRYFETPPLDLNAPGAFRFAERGKLAGCLKEASATSIRERLLKFQIKAPISRDEFWEMRSGTSGTLREKLEATSPELRARVENDMKAAVAEFFPNEQMNFPAQMIIVTGRKA